MSCPTLEQLAEYNADALPARIGAHVQECARCQRVLAELRATMTVVESLPAPAPPEHLWAGVSARIAERPAHGQRWWWRAAVGMWVAASLAIGIFALQGRLGVLPSAPPAAIAYAADHQFLSAQDPLTDRASLGVMLAAER